ncbi:GTPase Era [Desulfonema magnum]|uniref:GTPase Era n=1 Tax=Desulfonema magnum TaxID=45655 RepID=A0A975BL25_9BACT|nr:GTPase Era [Desulfonema magnum]QTA87054.1 GTPase [Desulfonema magnum]
MQNINNRFPGFKSGFVAIAGAPNVGKSTLLNRMLGEKISITSKKPQTTRDRILGVVHRPAAQLVFLDTPGIHRAKNELNVRIVDVAFSSISGADLILLMADVTSPDPVSEAIVVKKLKAQKKPVILALNKTDLIKKPEILTLIDKWTNAYEFEAVVPISAKHGEQVEELLLEMEKVMPDGPPYFPEESLTDMPERFIAAEMIREKVFRFTGQEIPYSTAVTVDSFSEDKKLVKIHATIHLERDSQKGILIGKGGSKLKQIGEEARKEIERMVGTKVFLKLFVRVQKNWSKDTKALRKFGY